MWDQGTERQIYANEMPRKARLSPAASFLHVMARGIEGRDLFATDEDRERFLGLLSTGLARTAFELHATNLSGYRLMIWRRSLPLPRGSRLRICSVVLAATTVLRPAKCLRTSAAESTASPLLRSRSTLGILTDQCRRLSGRGSSCGLARILLKFKWRSVRASRSFTIEMRETVPSVSACTG